MIERRFVSTLSIAAILLIILIALPSCKDEPTSGPNSGIQNQIIITLSGRVSTFAGTSQGFLNGRRETAQFYYPYGLAFDAAGSCYVADGFNNCIRKISPSGEVSTFVGGSVGSSDGQGSQAQFNAPHNIAFDSQGNLFVTDTENNSIRKVTPGGVVSTIAGGTMGFVDGSGTSARFTFPSGIAIDKKENIFVSDIQNHAIRMIAPTGEVSTFAGGSQGDTDGVGGQAQFNTPGGLAFDGQGNLFVADVGNNRIREITADRVVTTFAGSTKGFTNGTTKEAKFASPTDIAFDSAGRVLVADTANNCVRRVGLDGSVTTLAGGSYGKIDGLGSLAKFCYPENLAFDSSGCLYVSDTENSLIRMIR